MRIKKASLISLLILATEPISAANSWTLASPDHACEISVSLDSGGMPTYGVKLSGKPILLPSPLGLLCDDVSLDRDLALESATAVSKRKERYDLFSGPAPRVDHLLNHCSLIFTNREGTRLALDLAVGNEGVAFRYRFPGHSSTAAVRTVQRELTGFAVPPGTRGWLQPYHSAGPYTPAYEDFYFNRSPGDPPPESRQKPVGWAFPALFKIAEGSGWALLTESGTDGSFCACHLSPDSSDGVYKMAFPLADESTRGHTNRFGPEPRSTLPWSLPWRVIVVGRSAGEIATSTLVTDLAPPSRIKDTSWIRPGRASWAWWAYPDGPAKAARFNEFTDFGARMGWEYTLFDAGWWTPGLSNIVAHALSKGVAPLAWMGAGDFYEARRRQQRLDEMVSAGVRGVKVDFWCSDRQEAIAAMQSLFEDAANRHLLVNLHGCTLPRGWQRTWPNFLTAEAVLGSESYMFEPNYTEKAAELNTVLPFTRNVAGPMDLTPVACTPKKYARTTTAAHELAAALIFNSGIIHYADRPEFFDSLPVEARQMLREAPARWDENRCLAGEPGRIAVFARRIRSTWFIAGLNGTGFGVPVNLDLTPFKKFRGRWALVEGADPSMQVNAVPLGGASFWQHEIPPRGGFVLRLSR